MVDGPRRSRALFPMPKPTLSLPKSSESNCSLHPFPTKAFRAGDRARPRKFRLSILRHGPGLFLRYPELLDLDRFSRPHVL